MSVFRKKEEKESPDEEEWQEMALCLPIGLEPSSPPLEKKNQIFNRYLNPFSSTVLMYKRRYFQRGAQSLFVLFRFVPPHKLGDGLTSHPSSPTLRVWRGHSSQLIEKPIFREFRLIIVIYYAYTHTLLNSILDRLNTTTTTSLPVVDDMMTKALRSTFSFRYISVFRRKTQVEVMIYV